MKKINAMKNILQIVFLLSSLQLAAQNFAPFNSSTEKLFRDSAGKTYSLTFQDAYFNLIDSVYIPQLNVQQNPFYSDSCSFWGGNMCLKQNKTGWAGSSVLNTNNSVYTFLQDDGDEISFNFNTNMNDTNLVYIDGTQMLKMSYANTSLTQVLGLSDSVNYYHLYHTDLLGNQISSALNQFQIAVGKQLGLISFFKIDSFPAQINTLQLLGDQSTSAGFFELNNEMLYDYAVGDEYQYYLASNHSNPSWGWYVTDYSKYIKYTILNKTLTPDSLIYLASRNTNNLLTNTQILDTIYLRYSRNDVIAGIPYEIFDGQHYKNFKLGTTCGSNYWELNMVNEPYNLAFCAIDTCWGGIDTQGPAATITTKYVIGLGQTFYEDNLFGGFNFTSHYITSSLIYFKRNGQICGVEQIVGIEDISENKNKFTIFPNPAKQSVNVQFAVTEDCSHVNLSIYNLQGQLVIEKVIPSQTNISNSTNIDINELNEGFYFVTLSVNGRILKSVKFIKI
jgi:hypothetical protein